jgi:hypothetical protein
MCAIALDTHTGLTVPHNPPKCNIYFLKLLSGMIVSKKTAEYGQNFRPEY